jgi:hypothetical protein
MFGLKSNPLQLYTNLTRFSPNMHHHLRMPWTSIAHLRRASFSLRRQTDCLPCPSLQLRGCQASTYFLMCPLLAPMEMTSLSIKPRSAVLLPLNPLQIQYRVGVVQARSVFLTVPLLSQILPRVCSSWNVWPIVQKSPCSMALGCLPIILVCVLESQTSLPWCRHPMPLKVPNCLDSRRTRPPFPPSKHKTRNCHLLVVPSLQCSRNPGLARVLLETRHLRVARKAPQHRRTQRDNTLEPSAAEMARMISARSKGQQLWSRVTRRVRVHERYLNGAPAWVALVIMRRMGKFFRATESGRMD